jgi:hypothetical protein
MKTNNMAMLLTLVWTGLVSSAYAQGEGASVLKLPQDIEFKGPATGGAANGDIVRGPDQAGGIRNAGQVFGWLERPAALASR